MRRTPMGGLGKPISQRGAPAARTPNHYTKNPNRSGALRSGYRDNSPFVSSYAGDKEEKYRKKTKEKIKKWVACGSVALLIAALVLRQSSTPDETARIRTGTAMSTKPETTAAAKVDSAPAPPLQDPSILKGKNFVLEKGLENKICGVEIPVDLADVEKWPTPYTPLLENGKVASDAIAKEVVLLKKETLLRSWGGQLTTFFHAYDVAYSTNRPLYITQDAWVMDALLPLFIRNSKSVHDKEKVYAYLETILRVKIVESERELSNIGITVPDHVTPNNLFLARNEGLGSAPIRNHRETILRQLIQYPAEGACSTLETYRDHLATDGKYTVIHLNAQENERLAKLNASTGKDHSAAGKMQPDYILNILRQTNMLHRLIVPIFFADENPADSAVMKALHQNPKIAKLTKYDGRAHELGGVGGDFYMAVLATVYIGNPSDHISFWIARTRMALGIGDTYVLTELQGTNYVSYVDNENHLELYDRHKLGLWMG